MLHLQSHCLRGLTKKNRKMLHFLIFLEKIFLKTEKNNLKTKKCNMCNILAFFWISSLAGQQRRGYFAIQGSYT